MANYPYYIPNVSNGVLSWTPTDSSMPTVESSIVKGDRGQRGARGAAGIIIDADGNIDMTQYATEEYVNDVALNGIDLTEYATKEYVDSAVEKGSGAVDLSGYYTKVEVDALIPDTSGFITAIPSEYVTDSELTAKGYATETYVTQKVSKIDLTNYALKSEIPTVPTNVSAFTNDTGYVNASYVQTAINESSPDLSEYAKKTDIPDVSGFITEIPDEYLTDSEAEEKYARITDIPDVSEFVTEEDIPDVSGFITKEDLPDTSQFVTATYVQTAINESIPDVSQFITEEDIPDTSQFITEEDLPDVSQFVTAAYVQTAITENAPDLSGYATKSEIPDISGLQTEEQVIALITDALAEIGVAEEGAY